MKISSRVDYALSCVLHIVEQYGKNTPVSVKYISQQESLDIDYVEQLLITLKKAGILKSVRGIKGGILLARWEDFIEIAGDMLKLTEHYPTRYQVDDFPTEEQIEQLKAREDLL